MRYDRHPYRISDIYSASMLGHAQTFHPASAAAGDRKRRGYGLRPPAPLARQFVDQAVDSAFCAADGCGKAFIRELVVFDAD